ncbi:MAG TPA: N-acetylmuramoyl-L-alanine amidase [Rhizomicrobium sp.]|nr:N-acetylmuramoyl-L-alanine amidase [Rhizomicrobium sp.]
MAKTGLWRIVGLLLLGSSAVLRVCGSEAKSAVQTLEAPDNFGPADAQPIVMDARIGERSDRTRFVVETSDPVRIRVFTLAKPDRVVVDMPEVQWRLGAAPRPSGRGAVKSYRYGLFRPGDSRFVIDLNRPVSVAPPLVLPPQGGYGYRIVLDLLPATQASFEQTSGWPADLRAREGREERAAAAAADETAILQKAVRRVIVVDAGHGGIDSGTRSAGGAMEKDLVLDEAFRLGQELERRGYVVHLTRDSDVYVPLRERVDAARSYRADLFISLHADSNPDPRIYGASVYTLSEASSDRQAAALASKENQSDIVAGVDLSGESSPVASILIDLAQHETMNRSARFAQALVTELGHATDILPRAPHRSAGFFVLKAPDIPSVLVELGYLSNAGDCAQMATERWRDGVAAAIANAVDRQFRPERPVLESAEAAK